MANPTWDETEPVVAAEGAPPSWDETSDNMPAEPESLGHSLARGAIESAPIAGALLGGITGSGAGPVGAVGGAGLGYAAGHQLEKLGKQYLLGEDQPAQDPLDQAGEVGKDVALGSTAEMGGMVASKALSPVAEFIAKKYAPAVADAAEAGAVKSGELYRGPVLNAEPVRPMIPTEPVKKPFLDKLADATDVTGHAKSLLGKASKVFGEIGTPPAFQKAANVVADIGGRVGVYHSPHLAPFQAVSDAARVASKAQTGAAYLLEKAPEKLGKFAPMLQQAAKRGATGLATADFLLQKTDPEYQELMKKARKQ